MLRFGLVGLGHHGKTAVLPSFYFPEAEGVELVAICDTQQEALDAIDKPLEKYLSLDEMLAKSDIDAVYVASGVEYHCQLALDALNAGKHVICEKPMAPTLDECRLMTETAKRLNLVLAINFETRYSQKNYIIRRWMKEGRFGKVEAIHLSYIWDGHKNFGSMAERRARLISASGAMDCGVHKLDQARFLFGGKWTTMHAVGAWFGEPFKLPPHITAIGVLDSGVMVTVNSSLGFASQIKPRPMIENAYIAGNDGVAIINTDVLAYHTVCELSSRTMCEKIEFDETGHASDIALLLADVAKYVASGLECEHIFATGEDGYQAQYAMELANKDAVESRVTAK